jgi:hypothetical protein
VARASELTVAGLVFVFICGLGLLAVLVPVGLAVRAVGAARPAGLAATLRK